MLEDAAEPHACDGELLSDRSSSDRDDSSMKDKEKQDMVALEAALPALRRAVRLLGRVGSGTFSVVYAARARGGRGGGRGSCSRQLAVKHLLPTAHPARIAHELRCLRDIGGKHNVIGVDLCLRHLDNVVFVMPYIPHQKFSEYVESMDAAETRDYMRALFTALAHVHSFGVIHRDVKPANFLYDRQNRRYMLVDFGLAHRVVRDSDPLDRPMKRPCEEGGAPPAKRAATDRGGGERGGRGARLQVDDVPPFLEVCACACAGAGGVCAACARRPPPRAPRAGTQGFRPPEVLLRVRDQTTAVDVWAAGVLLASVLAARLPLLRALDDQAALAELAALLGSARLAAAAARLRRRLLLSAPRPPLCLRRVCARLRRRAAPAPAAPAPAAPAAPPCRRCRQPGDDCLCPDDRPATEIVAGRWWAGFPDAAFSLLAALLEPLPARRLTARRALAHPFLADC